MSLFEGSALLLPLLDDAYAFFGNLTGYQNLLLRNLDGSPLRDREPLDAEAPLWVVEVSQRVLKRHKVVWVIVARLQFEGLLDEGSEAIDVLLALVLYGLAHGSASAVERQQAKHLCLALGFSPQSAHEGRCSGRAARS